MPEPVELLDQLDAAWEKATPGPWKVEGGDVWTVPEFDLHRFDVMGERVAKTDVAIADAALIVAAVNHLPALTSALRAVLQLADELDEETAQRRNPTERVMRYDATERLRATVASSLAHPTNQEGATL